MTKKVVLLTIITILGMIIGPTIYKIYTNNRENYLKVVKKEFSYYASKCFYEDKCENTVYLKDLYENNYLKEKLTDPITKKYYSDSSYINLDNGEVKLMFS